MSRRQSASWAVVATGLVTALMVSPEAARSQLRSLGLSIGKPAALAAGALACACVCALAWRGRRWRVGAFEGAALGALACGGISAALRQVQLPFFLPWLAAQLAALVLLTCARQAAEGEERGRERVLDGLIVIACLIAALAIYEAAGGALWWDAPRRPGATFGNRNAVGGFCAIALPLAVARCWERPRSWRAAAPMMLALAVLLCRARSSWLALLLVSAAAAGALLAARRRRGPRALPPGDRRAALTVAAALVTALAAAAAVPWRLAWKEPSPMAASFSRLLDYESGTGKSRVEQHLVGLEMLAAHPLFGVGPGTWRREAPRYAHAAPGQHVAFLAPLWTPASDLLRHLVELGLVGMATAMAMAALLLRAGWRRLRRGGGAQLAAARQTAALLASFAAALIICAFDGLLARPASLALVAAIAGLLRGDDGSDDGGRADDAQGGGRAERGVAGWVAGTAMIAAATTAVAIAVPRYVAARRLAADFSPRAVLDHAGATFLPFESTQVFATTFARRLDCERGAKAAAVALRYLPNEPRLLQILARCEERRGRPATELWRRALELEPHDEEAKQALRTRR